MICNLFFLESHQYAVVQALARAYKQSLAFAFGLSRQHYGETGARRAAALQPLLASAALERFANEVQALTLPPQRWQGWRQHMEALIADGKTVRCMSS